MREALLAFVLSVAASLVVIGVALWSIPAAFVAAGVLCAGLGALFLVEA